ncbi:MAG: hypothetical protein EOO13_09225 [Chitinophagaceae bacterium]|nr:MAG: hypothetical protein EOO13_09225 [Chitinophagaceae bacterium]
MMNKIFLAILFLVFARPLAYSQSVGIGTNAPDASALLELKATNKGFLPPRLTAAEKAAIPSPKAGLLVYQTDAGAGLQVYNGITWVAVAGSGSPAGGWSLTGNSGTNAAVNFIGTTDNQVLRFRQGNHPAGLLDHFNENAAFGTLALLTNNGGVFNSAFGAQALLSNSTGKGNSAFGRSALLDNTTGMYNVAIGSSALEYNVDGMANTAVGSYAANSNVSGFSNIAMGSRALFTNKTGYRIIAIGDSALFNNTGSENVALGSKALYTNEDGIFNTALGNQALYFNTSGSQNTAVGRSSLYSNTAGIQNTGIGFQSMYNNWTGNRNTALGYNSLMFNNSGSDNTALGYGALAKNISNVNTAIGAKALNANTSGVQSTAIGFEALVKNTTGSSNVAVGSLTMDSNIDGAGNTTIGDLSMRGNINGWNNTAIGLGSLASNVSGNFNSALGYKADMIGSNYTNATAIGAFTEVGCSNCVVLGSINGYNGATANSKVGIGSVSPQRTLHVNPNGSGGMMIGNDITTGGFTVLSMGISQAAGGYSYIQSVKSAWPASTYGDLVLNQSGGNVGIKKTTPLTPLHIKQSTDYDNLGGLRLERNENGNYWDISNSFADVLIFAYKGTDKVRFSNTDGDIWTSSDLRLKKDIQNFETALPKLMQLQAKSYHYKDNESGAPVSYGFIAQEVEKIFPGAVSTSPRDGMKAVAYQKLNILAIKSIQEQQAIIEAQQKEVAEVKEQNSRMLERIQLLEKAVADLRQSK